MGRRTKQFDKP